MHEAAASHSPRLSRYCLSTFILVATSLVFLLPAIPADAQVVECIPLFPPNEVCADLPPAPVNPYPVVQDPTSRAHTSDALMYTWDAKANKTILGVYVTAVMRARQQLGIPDKAWALTTQQDYLVRQTVDRLLLERAEQMTMPVITEANGQIDNLTRNCFWSVLMTKRANAGFAERFGNAHEDGDDDQPPEEAQMDKHNNPVGRDIGVNDEGADDEITANNCQQAARDGRLQLAPY